MNTPRQWEWEAGHPSSISGTRWDFSGSYSPARVNYITLSPRPGVDWQSGSPYAPGSGAKITRQRGVSLDVSTRSSSSGTSMSISSNSKLKAACTFSEGHLEPTVAASNGAFDRDFSGHLPNITTTAQEGGFWQARSFFGIHWYLDCVVRKFLHKGSIG